MRRHPVRRRSLAALVESSDAELLARFDGDDVNEPERLRAQVEFLDRNPHLVATGTWMNHIAVTDRAMGHYIKENRPRPASV